jgi:hypothetical protein
VTPGALRAIETSDADALEPAPHPLVAGH